MTDIEQPDKTLKKFICECCDFKCDSKGDWNKHIIRPKHLENDKRYKMVQSNLYKPNAEIDEMFYCECGKGYKYTSGLWRHKNKCNKNIKTQTATETTTPQITPEMVITLIQQNKELQQTLIEQNKTIMILAQNANATNNNINYNNNNNKTFNLQVFLNETCKDALSLTEFINQIQVSFNELEDTGHLGYAEGISKVFLKNLKGIDYNRRPIHCSDIKRETIYIKDDENKWEKDDEQKSALTKAIKNVANKNIKKITEWQKMHPDYNDSYSKQNDKYMKIVLNSMSGSTKAESEKNYEKIVKNVVKEVVINKSTALI
jgi:hypothetical protein